MGWDWRVSRWPETDRRLSSARASEKRASPIPSVTLDSAPTATTLLDPPVEASCSHSVLGRALSQQFVDPSSECVLALGWSLHVERQVHAMKHSSAERVGLRKIGECYPKLNLINVE